MGNTHAFRALRQIPGVTKEVTFKQKALASVAMACEIIDAKYIDANKQLFSMADQGLCAAFTMMWISMKLVGDDVLKLASRRLSAAHKETLGVEPGFMKRIRSENADAKTKEAESNRELGPHTGLVPLALDLQYEYKEAGKANRSHKDCLSIIADKLQLEVGDAWNLDPGSLGPQLGESVLAGFKLPKNKHCFGLIISGERCSFFDSEVGEYSFDKSKLEAVIAAYVEALKKHFGFQPQEDSLIGWHVKKKAIQVATSST